MLTQLDTFAMVLTQNNLTCWAICVIFASYRIENPILLFSYGVMVALLILVQTIVVRVHVGKLNGTLSDFDQLSRFLLP
ncbi:hypothetical protein FHS10_002418 [Mucilaginibacter dorajii]|nr:hypothetical protein [Mucilaginibacter dorajii]